MLELNANPVDFVTILRVRCKTAIKKIAIISAGDDDNYLKKNIYEMLGNGVYHIFCCSRSVNREGSTLKMLNNEFSKTVFPDSNVKELKNVSEVDSIAHSLLSIIINP